MNFESLFEKLLSFYGVKTVTDLANKLNVTRSTVSGWKNRQAVGTVLEFLFINDPKALIYIFSSDIKTQNDTNKDEIKINDILLDKAQIEASKFGLNINSYIEHLIIQDLNKQKDKYV